MDLNSTANTESDGRNNGKANLTLNCLWWQKRRASEKRFIVVCFLLMLICLILIIVNIITEIKYQRLAKKEDNVCNSKECITAAARILENMDPSADPCNDFYQFACGNYIQRHTIPDDHLFAFALPPLHIMQQTLYVTLKKLIEIPLAENDPLGVKQAKNFYASCVNTSNIEDGSLKTLMKYLNKTEFGEWPILNPNWKASSADLERMLSKLFVHGVKPFFDISIKSGYKNSSDYYLFISFDDRFQYNFLGSSDTKNVQYVLLYKRLLSETIHLLGVKESISEKDLEDMLNFEIEIGKISNIDYSSEDTASTEDDVFSNPVDISILEKEIPEIKWRLFLDYVYNDFRLLQGTDNLKILLQSVGEIKNLAHLLKRISPRTVTNFLSWSFVRQYLPYLNIRFQTLHQEFLRNLPKSYKFLAPLFSTVWKKCIHLAMERFSSALSFLYYKEDYQEETVNEVAFFLSSIKKAFIENIYKQSWLDNNSKKICENKVKAMGSKIGYPPEVLNHSYLNAEYHALSIHPDEFFGNVLQLNYYKEYKLFQKFAEVRKEDKENLLQPLEINALFYKNIMYFSASVLKIPIFCPGCPRFLNYGSFGVIAGHEMTHGFNWEALGHDDTEQGFIQWLSDDKKEDFKKQLDCYIEQYSRFPIDMTDQNINGKRTVADNLCDSSGVAQAYRAYRNYVSKYGEEPRLPGILHSNEQVFFIGYGQMYCEVLNKETSEKYQYYFYSPGKYRVNVPLMNLPEFSSAFNCPVGSPMNPIKRCRLWS